RRLRQRHPWWYDVLDSLRNSGALMYGGAARPLSAWVRCWWHSACASARRRRRLRQRHPWWYDVLDSLRNSGALMYGGAARPL
ncbi:hypothetical protein, partial [Aquitalea magnusonii]|uniref:hypothetical protein n=1 Tax=Aquitalea magnusonii TaxID=332411 RepID=UPI001379EA52